MELTKMFADAGHTIPVPMNDPEIMGLLALWSKAQTAANTAIEISRVKIIAAQDSINRAMPFTETHPNADINDPQVMGILAELSAARQQAHDANVDTLAKMKSVVDILARIESVSRTKCKYFN